LLRNIEWGLSLHTATNVWCAINRFVARRLIDFLYSPDFWATTVAAKSSRCHRMRGETSARDHQTIVLEVSLVLNIICRVMLVGNKTLTWRERKALKAFTAREIIYIYKLPSWIGRKTMASLVEKGVVEVIDPEAGPYTQQYGWRVKSKPDEAG
jgi:hypothetical protein